MPERANSLASAFLTGTLAAAALLGVTTVSLAGECLESPDLKNTRPGHWFYRVDRATNRKCWHFDAAEATANTPAVPAPAAAAPADDPSQSPLSRFLSQTFSAPPQQRQAQPPQSNPPENPAEAAPVVAPKPAKPAKTVRREKPEPTQPPVTNGSASNDRREQAQQVQVIDRTDKPDSPADVAEREALFQDFVKWQMDRSLFGRP